MTRGLFSKLWSLARSSSSFPCHWNVSLSLSEHNGHSPSLSVPNLGCVPFNSQNAHTLSLPLSLPLSPSLSPSGMASNRDRDEALTFTNPSSSSSPIAVSDPFDSFLTDPTSRIGSASGSFQNEGLLSDSTNDAEFGFSRLDFRTSQLAGTVEFYQRHVFLCYKNPQVWPARIEASEFDRVPRLLSASVMARKADMKKETRLTICEGHDGTDTSNGDVLIFPDMIRYRRLTHFDVDTFVEEVLVRDGEWLPGTPETLKGSYVFVCSHGSRDRRCGVCGPALVSRFKEGIELHGLQSKVSVSPCSHIGGHKYAGNIIIFGSNLNGEVTGHWYGYVSPEDVPELLEQHIVKGEIVDWLWRGQMGLSEEEQRKSQELRLQLNGEINVVQNIEELTQTFKNETLTAAPRSQVEVMACCPENGDSYYYQNPVLPGKLDDNLDANVGGAEEATAQNENNEKLNSGIKSGKGAGTHKVCAMPTWFDSWEREDTFAALAVVCAAASVAIAYSCYKQLR